MNLPKPEPKPDFDPEIKELLAALKDTPAGTDDYNAIVNNLTTLVRAQETYKSRRVTGGQVLAAVTNVLGIAAVLQHEKLHVIATKAFGMVGKLKI